MEIDPRYFYVAATMVSVLVTVARYVALPRGQVSMLWSGAPLVPFAFIEAPLATEYGPPEQFTNGGISIEDLLWTFVFGCIAWVPVLLFANEPHADAEPGPTR